MSIYSGAVSTRILEPVSHSQRRTEFRINDDEVYLSNIRLINVGADTDTSSEGNGSVGLPSIIKSIHLYSGNQLLDQVTDWNMWACFKGINHENSTQSSIRRENDGNAFGFEAIGSTDWHTTEEFPNRQGIKQTQVNEESNLSFDNSDSANTAWISLREVFGFLKSSPVVPTNILRNLRLVINYNNRTEMNNIALDDNIGSLDVYRPLLIVDEMNESPQRTASMNGYTGITYESVENDVIVDRAIVGPADGTKAVENTYLLNGFNQKYVDKFVVALQPTLATTWEGVASNTNNELVGNLGSMSCNKSRLQFRVNGQNKFMGCTVEGKMKRLGYVVDYCGEMNVPVGGNFTNLTNTEVVSTTDYIGHIDYTVCPVEEYCNELKLTFGRDAVGATGNDNSNQQLLINCFGIVRKNLRVNRDGSFVISY